MVQHKITLLIVFLLLASVVGWFSYAKKTNPTLSPTPKPSAQQSTELKHSIPLDEILDGGPGKDGIPSIDHPKFITPTEALRQLQPNGPGLVVSIKGDSRFYPYQILVWHEIANDTVGGTPVLVSFCPLCNTGIVFERKVNSEAVEFGVSGKLYNSDLLMYDRKTDSLWSQIFGKAVVGPLTDTELTQLEANQISLSSFVSKFPNGKVLSKDTGFSRDYERNPYGNYSQTSNTLFPVSKQDSRLSPKTIVYGIEVAGTFKAYTEEALKSQGRIVDSVNGHKIELKYNDGLISIVDLTTGSDILAKSGFWFAWIAFHPESEIYNAT